ncbi:MAG: nucleoside deaminase [Planctomycetota bacterium]
MFPKIELELPSWLEGEVQSDQVFETLDERMALTIRLSSRNVHEGTGGPFGAAVFERDTGRLIAAGVNIVVASHCSIAHAEAIALMIAQKRLGTYDLAAEGLPAHELVASSQPCIQCFGNIWWSGVRRVVIGARGEDVERLTGFDEGPLPEGWEELLRSRESPPGPIQVVQDVLAEDASRVLQRYRDEGGEIYNAGSGRS